MRRPTEFNPQVHKEMKEVAKKSVNELPELISNQDILAIIGPDVASMEDFSISINDVAPDVPIENVWRSVEPRIVTTENGPALTQDTEKVITDLADSVKESMARGHRVITIACNTLSLEEVFVAPTIDLLKQEGFTEGKDYYLVTPLRALVASYEEKGERPPMFLGTLGISENLSEDTFDTLTNTGHREIAEMVQEIIWRIKAVNNADVGTAPEYPAGPLDSEDVLNARLQELENQLIKIGVTEVVMGCTELPIGFALHKKNNPDSKLITVNPAQFVAEKAKQLMDSLKQKAT